MIVEFKASFEILAKTVAMMPYFKLMKILGCYITSFP